MDGEWKPNDGDVKKVMETHGLVPEGLLLDEALGLVSLYADLIRRLLAALPEPADRQKAIMAIIEEGLMQEGIIPNSHERKFIMSAEIEQLFKKLSNELAGAPRDSGTGDDR